MQRVPVLVVDEPSVRHSRAVLPMRCGRVVVAAALALSLLGGIVPAWAQPSPDGSEFPVNETDYVVVKPCSLEDILDVVQQALRAEVACR